jgi:uncharacterized cupredoxin-like copper-binding protein
VLVYGLTTGHKIGLGVVAATFIGFALLSTFLFPRFRSTFPGRGLPAFVIVCFLFFFGMLTAVEVFGAEPEEKQEAVGLTETVGEPTTEAEPTTTVTLTAEPDATTTTAAKPNPKPKPKPVQVQTVGVTETEFKIAVASSKLKPGTVIFNVKNAGAAPHNLIVTGNGATTGTPIFNSGKSVTLKASLKPGTYELYCSVPGHKQAGMDLKVTVGG